MYLFYMKNSLLWSLKPSKILWALAYCGYCRLLSAGLHSEVVSAWVTALKGEEVMERILWVVANTMNSQLLEKVC